MCSRMCLGKEVGDRFSETARILYLSTLQWVETNTAYKLLKDIHININKVKMHIINEETFKLSIYQGNAIKIMIRHCQMF